MCLNVPRKVIEIGEDGVVLDYSGESRKVEICLVDLEVGDYCLVSGGVVVSKVEEERAVKFLEALDEVEF